MIRLAAALAAAAALALGACGEGSGEREYVEQVEAVTEQLVQGASTLTPKGGSPKQIAINLETVAGRYEAAAAELAAISPPDQAAALHAELVADLTRLSEATSEAAAEIRSGGAAGAVGVLGGLTKQAKRVGIEIEATIARINAALGS